MAYNWYGIKNGQRQARFWAGGIAPKDIKTLNLKDYWNNRIRMNVFFMDDERLFNFYKNLERNHPAYFYGYPNSINEFCRFIKENNLAIGYKPKVIITTAETLLDDHKKRMERVLKAPVANEYGSAEAGVITFTCPKGSQHVMGQNIYLEILDGNKRVKEGESGEMVVTEFRGRGLPFIRYRIGDIGKNKVNNECSCGLPYPVTELIQGRMSDTIYGSKGQKASSNFIYYQLEDTKKFQVSQTAPGILIYKIVPKQGIKISEDKIQEELKLILGDDFKVNFEYCDNIPVSKSGKFQAFIPLKIKQEKS